VERRAAKKAGRGAARLPKIIEVAADFTKDKAKAVAARKEYWAGAMVPAMFTQRLHTPKLSEANGKVVGSEVIEKATCISDDPADHVEHARHYLELGFDLLYFHSAGPDQTRFIEAYGELVLPQLKARRSRKSSGKLRKRA
jgi:coenzyme F420-dependent glucose-6-phosphate dehydrogenase